MACCTDLGQPAKLNYIGLQEPRPGVTITVSVVLHNNQRVTQLRIGVGSSCLPVAVQVNVNKTTSVIPTASVIQPIIIIINMLHLNFIVTVVWKISFHFIKALWCTSNPF